MAEAFVSEQSSLYHNPKLLKDIISGMEWMNEHRYNEQLSQYSNWWHWEIGGPQALNNLVVLLYSYLDEEKINRYMDVVDHFQPAPTKSGATTPDNYREAFGANRVDVSKVVAVRGIIVKDPSKIAASRDALSQVFEYVTEGNGFYKDGSFVQHEDIAYTGSYGIVLIEGLTELLEVFSGSTWKVTNPNVNNVYEWIQDSFEPLMYKGSLMDMVRGRAISRDFLQDHNAGHSVIKTVVRMGQFAPEPYGDRFLRMAKHWIQEDTFLDYIENAESFRDITLAKTLLSNNDIKPRGELYLHKTFASMDRVVHRKPGYAFGLSMYSNRIQNYEDMNNENRKGWYTGEGMAYLYNDDLGQFSDGYWPTVDPYRMPGTTIDTMTRTDGSGEHRSTQSWTGGSTLNEQYGTAGMSYDAWNSSLQAKKSWFMFDNEIVALGADITSSDDRPIETIVENRKIRQDGSNKVIINGESPLNELGSEKEIKEVEWAYLEGNGEGADIGYYFPEKANLYVKKEQREGKWSDINYGGPEEVIKRSYATMWLDHGKNPNAERYAYTLLPNQSADEIEQYAANPDVQILRNDKAVQAVHETTQNILGANFWESTKQQAGPLTVYDKASITMKEIENELEIAVSDPTMENDGTIEVEIDRKAFGVIKADEGVKVTKLKPFIKLEIDVKEAKGKTFTTKLQLNPKQSDQSDHFLTDAKINQEQMEANGTVDAVVNISSQTNDREKATVTTAFYNWKGELKKAVHHEEDFEQGQSKEIKQSLNLPQKIDGGEVRIFMWKGKDFENGEYQLLSNVVTFPVTDR
ncbi:hypothetical protein JOC86_003856 [Bacillus pakistanensis]|uniref:Hyaluronate lyase n=2 Tax=Rossellomorea pakistanensis TaxID=992288 RepID=A0ABS2NHI7_9BACI|nr:hypothetical protein [Bacillus pakistanensis]